MGVYLITGKLGSGKTLATVGRIRDALRADKTVATNLDIFMDGLASPNSRRFVMRLPDHPTVDDFNALGRGQAGIEESDNGLIVLDECGTWLNTRSWADKGRQHFIDWLLHSRKLGWDVYLIIQDISLIDKQVRTALVEFLVTCKRLDRLAIPLITPIGKIFGAKINPPKIHLGIVKYGTNHDAPVSDRWMYQAKDLYSAYDTKQVYRPSVLLSGGVIMPPVGLHCTLSAWHLKGRYMAKKESILPFLLSLWWRVPMYGIAQFCVACGWLEPDQAISDAPVPIPKHPIAVMLSKLPPDQAVKHWKRFNALGAFS
ncbi:MAG: hypothetical protein LLG15_01500 [Betaproteobacteria bacterium]|nr:hypothetical protein [Betaproteobacteria bacterium]